MGDRWGGPDFCSIGTFCSGAHLRDVTGGSESKRNCQDRRARRALIPLYRKAIQEENLQDLLLIRHELAATVEQADRILVDAVTENIQRRLAEDG